MRWVDSDGLIQSKLIEVTESQNKAQLPRLYLLHSAEVGQDLDDLRQHCQQLLTIGQLFPNEWRHFLQTFFDHLQNQMSENSLCQI
jgi:hypothetical protein